MDREVPEHMSDVKKLSQLSSASSLDGLSLVATDGSGNARRVPARAVACAANGTSMSLEEMITSTGVSIFNTGEGTDGLPDDAGTKYGMMIAYTFMTGQNALLLWFSFSTPAGIYSQQKLTTWRGWKRLV